MERQDRPELLEAIGQLKAVVETQLAEIHGQIAELVDKLEHVTEVLREQTEEMGALYDAIDDYRELMEWTLRNRSEDCERPFQLTSVPFDPAAEDFDELVNRFTADLPSGQSQPTPGERGSPNESCGSPTETGLLF